MRFLAQGCSANEYMEAMKPALYMLSQRYKEYAKRFAQKLKCDVNVVEPYVYMSISSISNNMSFGEQSYIIPQMEIVKNKLIEVLCSSVDAVKRKSDMGTKDGILLKVSILIDYERSGEVA